MNTGAETIAEQKLAKAGKKNRPTSNPETETGPGRGRLAYEVYGTAREWKTFNGEAMPKFEEQSPELQTAWNLAAEAVVMDAQSARLRQAELPGRGILRPRALVVTGGKRLVIAHVQSYGPIASGRPDDCGISFFVYTGMAHGHEIGQWIPPSKEGDKVLTPEARKKLRDEMLEGLDELFGAADLTEK